METQTTETITIEQRVDRLAKHLLRAGKGQKAAILFAVYRSEFARAEAEKLLEAQLQAASESIVRVRVQAEGETVDLPRYLRNHPKKGQAIFFIYDVTRGGDATQQYLNYRREFLVEDRQRLLLWLHEKEIGQLARHAPDFWAFRGRTLEFLEPPPLHRQVELADDLAYYNWQGNQSQNQEELEAGIHLREKLLAELPDDPAFLNNRAEILYTLAAQYVMKDNPAKAIKLFDEVEAIAEPTNIELLSRVFTGRGIAYTALGQNEAALADYEAAIRIYPEEAARVLYNRGLTYKDLGQYEAALADFKATILLNSENASAYNNRGAIYQILGRYEESLADYHKAVEIDPSDIAPRLNMALLKMAQDKPEESLHYLERALEIDPKYRDWMAKQSVFEPLWDDPRFQALVAPTEEEK